MPKPHYWLVKTEPHKYSWNQLVIDGKTSWDGVRNFEARNNLKAMTTGDLVLVYHSNEGKEVVGIARVSRGFYPDPTIADINWVAVDLVPFQPLAKPVSLMTIKTDPLLDGIALVRQGRLSVIPLTPAEFDQILYWSTR